jgi:hypothetical protein
MIRIGMSSKKYSILLHILFLFISRFFLTRKLFAVYVLLDTQLKGMYYVG